MAKIAAAFFDRISLINKPKGSVKWAGRNLCSDFLKIISL
jgi:hypothetical protein